MPQEEIKNTLKPLERLISKWEMEADRIKSMADNRCEHKSHRMVFNHFLIQLLKCIAEAKAELRVSNTNLSTTIKHG